MRVEFETNCVGWPVDSAHLAEEEQWESVGVSVPVAESKKPCYVALFVVHRDRLAKQCQATLQTDQCTAAAPFCVVDVSSRGAYG